MAQTNFQNRIKGTYVFTGDVADKIMVGIDGLLCGVSEKCVGITDGAVDFSDDPIGEVIVSGDTYLTIGGSVTKGDAIISDAAGKGVSAAAVTVASTVGSGSTTASAVDATRPTVTSVVSGSIVPVINAYALESGTTGQVIKVRLLA